MKRTFAVLVLVLLVLSGNLSAQDVTLSCSILSKKDGQRFAGKSVGKRNRLWDCGVRNSTPGTVVFDSSLILMALRDLDVPAINPAVLQTVVASERYRGRLYTWGRVLDHGSNLGILGMAIDLIKVDRLTSGLFALGSIIMPIISPALRARAPSTEDFVGLIPPDPISLEPGMSFSLSAWSSGYDGPPVVRGSLFQLIAPQPQTRAAQPAATVESARELASEWLLSNFPSIDFDGAPLSPVRCFPLPCRTLSPDSPSLNALRRVEGGSWGSTTPLPRCSHVLEADCGGRCEGWWRGAALVGL